MAVPSATNPTHFYTRFRHKPLNPKVSLDSNENLMRLQTGVKLTPSSWSPAQIQRGSGFVVQVSPPCFTRRFVGRRHRMARSDSRLLYTDASRQHRERIARRT